MEGPNTGQINSVTYLGWILDVASRSFIRQLTSRQSNMDKIGFASKLVRNPGLRDT